MGLFTKKNSHVAEPGRRRTQSSDVRPSPDASNRQYIFARNRTLTGSTSNSLSDASRQSDLRSPRTHAHHLALQRRKIGVVLLVVVAIVAFLAILVFQFTSRVTISTSDTSLSKNIDGERYVKAINEYLVGHPTSRLRFALDQNDLKNYLSSVLPEVADITAVSMGSIGETNITLSMRRPVAGWTINSKQYFVDANGIAFEENYFTNPPVEIIDNSGVALQQGATVASNRFLGFVGRVVALSKERGYSVVQAIIPTDTTRQLEVIIKDVVPRVKLSSDRGAGEQVEDMSRALIYLAARGQNPGYIDVRVSGKAFYK